jgi:predicted MFS family arabinose efflux permease
MARSRINISLLFATRLTRLFAYGFLSVILVLYLLEVGLSEQEVGLMLTFTLIGDAAISLWITTSADSMGRRRMLIIGSLLMVIAGAVFVLTNNLLLLVVAATIGVISPSGNEIGPFLSIEQAALSQIVHDEKRTKIFAWYNLAGSLATACGALAGGWLSQSLQNYGLSALASYRLVVSGYILCGLLLATLFLFLSPQIETNTTPTPQRQAFGLHQSKSVVFKLSTLFALDAFAGGFIIQSILAYWFHARFGAAEGVLGSIFFGANLLAGLSALLAVRIASRIGLIKTMIFTHIPSNILLCLVPLMPSLPLAIALLLMRFSISQMDVPTRQSYLMAVVSPDERSAASGVTSVARSVGAALSPSLSGLLLATPVLMSAPFFTAGGLKIIYDLLLYRSFKSLKPPEERSSAK